MLENRQRLLRCYLVIIVRGAGRRSHFGVRPTQIISRLVYIVIVSPSLSRIVWVPRRRCTCKINFAKAPARVRCEIHYIFAPALQLRQIELQDTQGMRNEAQRRGKNGFSFRRSLYLQRRWRESGAEYKLLVIFERQERWKWATCERADFISMSFLNCQWIMRPLGVSQTPLSIFYRIVALTLFVNY